MLNIWNERLLSFICFPNAIFMLFNLVSGMSPFPILTLFQFGFVFIAYYYILTTETEHSRTA